MLNLKLDQVRLDWAKFIGGDALEQKQAEIVEEDKEIVIKPEDIISEEEKQQIARFKRR